MFKNLCIIPNEPVFPLDMGFVAESFLFYKKVILVISQPNVLLTLLKSCYIDLLTELLNEGRLTIYWNGTDPRIFKRLCFDLPRAFGTCHCRTNPSRHQSYGKSQIPTTLSTRNVAFNTPINLSAFVSTHLTGVR